MKGLLFKNGMNLFSKQFFVTSCSGAMLMLAFTYSVVPVVGPALAFFSSTVFVYLIVERIVRKRYTLEMYASRYEVTMMIEVIVVSVALFYVESDYVLFIPIILGIVYLNVNAIMKSRRVYWFTMPFMLLPVVKIVMFKTDRTLEYASVIVLFILTVFISELLFRSTAQAVAESERRREMMHTVFKLMNHLTSHDVRNLCQRMLILNLEKYRNDPELFEETLDGFVEKLGILTDPKYYEAQVQVDIKALVESMSHVVQSPYITIKLCLEVPSFSCNKNMLYSTVMNLIENSVEAATRRCRNSVIEISTVGDELTLEDNCGGFDVSGIQRGTTSKPNGIRHGVFLRTITDPALDGVFGFAVDIQPVPNGTKTIINFNQQEHGG